MWELNPSAAHFGRFCAFAPPLALGDTRLYPISRRWRNVGKHPTIIWVGGIKAKQEAGIIGRRNSLQVTEMELA